jgi:hypothetical protein
MGWTKRELIDEAFGELALQGYEFDITPDEQQTALRRLDTMLATWEAKGVRVGYAFPSSPDDSDLDTPSGLPDSAVETVYLNLAIRLASGFGKQISSDTRRAAREGYDTLLWAAAQPIEQQLPSTMPRGAGNRIWRNSQRPYFPPPDDDPLGLTPGGDLSILPE